MPQVYTIATKNTFADLDDTDSEDLILSKPAEEVVEAASSQTAKNDPTNSDGKRPPRRNNNNNGNSNNINNSVASGTGSNVPEGSKPAQRRPRNNGPPATGSGTGSGVAVPESGDNARRGPRRITPGATEENPSALRQPRVTRRRPTDRPGGNESSEHMGMDRQSGTGRGREMKKDGSGAHNWGDQTDFGGGEEANPTEGKKRGNSDEERVNSAAAAPNPARNQPEVLSYDKYKAEISEKMRVADGSNEVDEEAEKQKYVQQGYEIYTKAARDPHSSQKRADNEDENENAARQKPIHLAELAAQSGVELRYGGTRRPKRDNREEGGVGSRRNDNDNAREDSRKDQNNSNKPPQQPQQQQPTRHEINLADKLAFPTLEAH